MSVSLETPARPRFRVRPLPRPSRPIRERRKSRSGFVGKALEMALTAAAERADLDAMLVADRFGMVVAASKTGFDLSMLAAITPVVGEGRAIPRVRYRGELRPLTVRTVEVLDEVLYVAALGGDKSGRRRELTGSAAATRRILN